MTTILEEDAKKKWCPIMDCECLGSDCMGWRWGVKRNPDYRPMDAMVGGYPPEHPDDVTSPWILSDDQGYCGFAGNP